MKTIKLKQDLFLNKRKNNEKKKMVKQDLK